MTPGATANPHAVVKPGPAADELTGEGSKTTSEAGAMRSASIVRFAYAAMPAELYHKALPTLSKMDRPQGAVAGKDARPAQPSNWCPERDSNPHFLAENGF